VQYLRDRPALKQRVYRQHPFLALAEDAWEALELRAQHKVPVTVQQRLLRKNARRLYAIETVMVVTERIEQYEPAKLLW
jgi:hypothetical protein